VCTFWDCLNTWTCLQRLNQTFIAVARWRPQAALISRDWQPNQVGWSAGGRWLDSARFDSATLRHVQRNSPWLDDMMIKWTLGILKGQRWPWGGETRLKLRRLKVGREAKQVVVLSRNVFPLSPAGVRAFFPFLSRQSDRELSQFMNSVTEFLIQCVSQLMAPRIFTVLVNGLKRDSSAKRAAGGAREAQTERSRMIHEGSRLEYNIGLSVYMQCSLSTLGTPINLLFP